MRTQTVTSDITVVGAGLAGVCAAIAAARLGMRVALVGNRPVLGGNSSSEVRVWVCGATAHGVQRFARESGVVGELYVENQFRNPEGNPIIWDEVVLDAVRAEPNIRLFLNTDVREVDAVDRDGERVVERVRGWTMGSEVWSDFVSPAFIDCTGDGLVGALAGASHRIGREAKHEFGESWAPDEADRQLLGSTILFHTKDVGHPVRFVAPESTKNIHETTILESRILRSGDTGTHYWWIEWGGELDTVDDNERIRDELKSVIFGIWDHIKNSGQFDAANLDLEWVGNLPGKREYRRFLGDHVLTQNDLLEQVDFDDAVAFGGWSIDLHPVEGMYATQPGAHQRFSNGIYGIPFRSLYSKDVANLLMAGRDISATHIAFGSSRVMATCGTLGEAAATGAALALAKGVTPRDIARDHAAELRQLLLRQDASVFGVRGDDPLDLARAARVSATSHRADVTPSSSGVPFPLVDPVGLVVPADPRIDGVDVLLDVTESTTLRASLWTTGKRQNAVPIRREAEADVAVEAGRAQWIRLPLAWAPGEAENVVVVLDADPAVSVRLADEQVPGVISLVRRAQADGDDNVEFDASEANVAWPAIPLRGRTVVARLDPPTEAYSPARAVGGFQRFYGGPNMWSSAASGAADDPSDLLDQPPSQALDEHLLLEWDAPQTVAQVRLVFDDDVDTELNTLHHHRTPEPIFPELARDYAVEALVDGSWTAVAGATGNRRRHRIHTLEEPVSTTALRIRVTATNGVPDARVYAVRAYDRPVTL
ncbi:FAD-dependent oxidoreductase [Microbacterium indicum]|uniref:FAD-dependent oxidoreductase n=1 Tax=Microbacterium indicum TaxID=358100 RepID=UPI000411EE46|nr:FAD-dependent oxidoreductase [Microbacterium indicum]